jgi:hypothetical protein
MSFMTPKTSAEWREIWIAKLEKACIEKGLTKPTIDGYLGFLTRYLAPHSCHPANIPLEAVSSFLGKNSKSEKQTKFCLDALTFFYTFVVDSPAIRKTADETRKKPAKRIFKYRRRAHD